MGQHTHTHVWRVSVGVYEWIEKDTVYKLEEEVRVRDKEG